MREIRCCDMIPKLRENETEPGSATISGHAAVFYDGTPKTEFNMWDMFTERIMPGAFDDVLRDDVRCLFNHDPNMILGRSSAGTLKLYTDEVGLRFENDLPDTAAGNDVRTNLRLGNLQGCSFAFTIDEEGERQYKEDGIWYREVTKVGALYDVGPVTFPAYEATDVQSNCRDLFQRQFTADTPTPGRGDRDKFAMQVALIRARQ